MDKRMQKQILRTAQIMLLVFALLMGYVVYLMTFAADGLAGNPLNSRNSLLGENNIRGRILDREDRVLAENGENGERIYPFGSTAAHVVGYHGSNCGSSGAEGYANRELLGITEDLFRMGPLSQLFISERGNDVRLTLDMDVQQAARQGLGSHRGAVVVLDVQTGEVLALVSNPSFDPDRIEEHWEDLLEQEDAPLLNRAISGLYPPGSTIKPLIADIALQQNVTDPGEIFNCTGVLDVGGGFTIRESHEAVHGPVTLGEALRRSCNITFGTLGMRLGGDGLREGFHRFGFDRPLRGELVETENHLPAFSKLDQGDLAQVGLGQSTLLVTPMHMALLAAAMENGGRIMKACLISEILAPDGACLYRAVPEQWMEVSSPERTKLIHSWMETVVSNGTGTAAAVPGVKIAGKTGTAENPVGNDHAWFIGSADVDGRQIAFAILAEHGGEGGRTAAPIAADIVRSLLE